MAAINAITQVLNVQPTGCLFHFNQNIYRHVQAEGLQTNYNTDNPPGLRKWIRRLMALLLVPPIRIPGVFAAIQQAAPNIPEAPIIHDYVNRTYLDPNNALFQVGIWNVFNSVDRTTNICEGYHSSTKRAIGVYRPSIYKIIEFLQEQEAEHERELAQLRKGAPPKKRKATYVRLDATIARLTVQAFGHVIPNISNILDYLDAVSFQLWDLKH